MTRHAIAGADQAVVLARTGDEWTWDDGQIGGSGFASAGEALAGYLSIDPVEEHAGYTTVWNASVETVSRKRT
jgi:hypothetical protein